MGEVSTMGEVPTMSEVSAMGEVPTMDEVSRPKPQAPRNSFGICMC